MSRTLGTQENGPAAAPPPQQIAAGQASDSSPSAITRVGSGQRTQEPCVQEPHAASPDSLNRRRPDKRYLQ